jgi:ribosomal protein S27E
MTDSSFIEVTCPKCRHVWHVDVATLDKAEQIIYRGNKPRQMKYRVRCPNDGTFVVVTVDFDEGDDG